MLPALLNFFFLVPVLVVNVWFKFRYLPHGRLLEILRGRGAGDLKFF